MSDLREILITASGRPPAEQIAELYRFLRQNELVIEAKTTKGWYVARCTAEGAAMIRDNIAYQALYVHHNPLSSQAQARYGAAWVIPEQTVHTEDMVALALFPIDVDPERAAPYSGKHNASAEEAQRAVGTAVRARALVTEIVGRDCTALLFSGNGMWCHVALDMLDPERFTPVVRRGLKALHRMFADGVDIDTKVADPRRLSPLPGSWKRKASKPDRPSRLTWIYVPEQFVPLSGDELVALVDELERRAPPAPMEEAPLPRFASEVSDRAPREQASAIPIASVLEHFGMYRGGQPQCAACGEWGPESVHIHKEANRVHCFRAKCRGPNRYGPIDLVLKVHFGGTLDDKHLVPKAINYLADIFGTRKVERSRVTLPMGDLSLGPRDDDGVLPTFIVPAEDEPSFDF